MNQPSPPSSRGREIRFVHALIPILGLLVLVVYGLIVRPQFLKQEPFPLEVVFVFASTIAIAELFYLGFRWNELEESIVRNLSRALPAFFILFTIGMIIGSWIVCGTIPMLVYYGIKWINPTIIYLFAFFVPIVFSLLTGTSWGSVGAIGIVVIGIAEAMGAHLGITAGAVIGGAFFGDKMSPLSDTTNLAALAAEVDLFDHIRSMTYTTFPSAIMAAVVFMVLGFVYPPTSDATNVEARQVFLQTLETMFNFHPVLVLPPAIVLVGSFLRRPTVPTLIVATLVACCLALIFQRFSLVDVLQSLESGFDTKMASWQENPPEQVMTLLNRGGLYSLIKAIVIAFTVFVFIGTMDCIKAIPTVVNRVFRFSNSRASTILSALAATAITNTLTANQYATSFIVGDAFKTKFDAMKIPRKVLSRSLEDAGTMLESVVPWSPSALFMVATLGVPFSDYWHWQLLSLINFIIAPTLAITGIGCFYHEVDQRVSNATSASHDSPESQG